MRICAAKQAEPESLRQVILGDYRLNPENGVLPQLIAGAAMRLAGVAFPDVGAGGSRAAQAWQYSDAWELGFQTLYSVGNDAGRAILAGRAAVALSGFGTVLVVHAVARHVHDGSAVGTLVPTMLAAACPTMLAHGALVTSDGCFTFFANLAAACIAAMLRHMVRVAWSPALERAPPSPPKVTTKDDRELLATVPPPLAPPSLSAGLARALLAGVAVGGMAAAKHSAVIVAPIALILLGSYAAAVPARALPRFMTRCVLLLPVSVAISIAVLWACYGFRYSAFAPGQECEQWRRNWDAGLGTQHGALEGVPATLVGMARGARALPEALLFGTSYAFLSTKVPYSHDSSLL